MRAARVERKTKESSVVVEINLDGTGQIEVDTGVPFFDHSKCYSELFFRV